LKVCQCCGEVLYCQTCKKKALSPQERKVFDGLPAHSTEIVTTVEYAGKVELSRKITHAVLLLLSKAGMVKQYTAGANSYWCKM